MLQRPNAINIAKIVHQSAVEGPGKRFVIWVQGCPLRCPQCCNPQMLPFQEMQWWPVEKLRQLALSQPNIEGVTILGGEPFAQAEALAKWCLALQKAALGIIVYTGFQRKTLEDQNIPANKALLAHIDLLIDGPYIASRESTRRRFIGSDNQNLHFLTPRYQNLKNAWPKGEAGLEIHFENGKLHCIGSPRLVKAWQQPQRTH